MVGERGTEEVRSVVERRLHHGVVAVRREQVQGGVRRRGQDEGREGRETEAQVRRLVRQVHARPVRVVRPLVTGRRPLGVERPRVRLALVRGPQVRRLVRQVYARRVRVVRVLGTVFGRILGVEVTRVHPGVVVVVV